MSTGCKPKEGMYRCTCPVPNGVCIQKEYCTCDDGYEANLNPDGSLLSCDALPRVAKSKGIILLIILVLYMFEHVNHRLAETLKEFHSWQNLRL